MVYAFQRTHLTKPLVPVSVPDSCSDIASISFSIFFFDRVFLLTVLRRRNVENIPSPLPEFLENLIISDKKKMSLSIFVHNHVEFGIQNLNYVSGL